MAFTVSVDAEREELFVLAEGEISLHDIRMHLEEEHAAGATGYRELIDARRATPVLSSDDLRDLVTVLRLEAQLGHLGPTAVVVGSEDALGMIRLLGMMLDDVARIRAFRDFAEAVDWLSTLPARRPTPPPSPLTWH